MRASRALPGLYGSLFRSIVVRLTEVPPAPADYDGAYGPWNDRPYTERGCARSRPLKPSHTPSRWCHRPPPVPPASRDCPHLAAARDHDSPPQGPLSRPSPRASLPATARAPPIRPPQCGRLATGGPRAACAASSLSLRPSEGCSARCAPKPSPARAIQRRRRRCSRTIMRCLMRAPRATARCPRGYSGAHRG